jgi:hypothetical protein
MKSTTMIKASNVPRSLARAATADPKERAFPGLIFLKIGSRVAQAIKVRVPGSHFESRGTKKQNAKHRELKRSGLKDEFLNFSGRLFRVNRANTARRKKPGLGAIR